MDELQNSEATMNDKKQQKQASWNKKVTEQLT